MNSAWGAIEQALLTPLVERAPVHHPLPGQGQSRRRARTLSKTGAGVKPFHKVRRECRTALTVSRLWRKTKTMFFALRPLCRLTAPLLLGLMCVAGLWPIAPAHADLQVCNRTQSRVGLSIGYKDRDGWVTEGWWNIGKGQCETILRGSLVARFYYLYGIDYDQGGEWAGKAFMCSRDKEFTIRGIESCLARGYDRTGFFEIDTADQRDWVVNLTEPAAKNAPPQLPPGALNVPVVPKPAAPAAPAPQPSAANRNGGFNAPAPGPAYTGPLQGEAKPFPPGAPGAAPPPGGFIGGPPPGGPGGGPPPGGGGPRR